MYELGDSFLGVDICDTSVDSPSLDSIPMVYDFSNVFPVNLLSIPTIREIEIVIDLKPCTQPISIVFYHMALAKLMELNSQL